MKGKTGEKGAKIKSRVNWKREDHKKVSATEKKATWVRVCRKEYLILLLFFKESSRFPFFLLAMCVTSFTGAVY